MLLEKLHKYKIVLGSSSTRRKELLKKVGIKFTVKTTNYDEKYPKNLIGEKITEYLAIQKSKRIEKDLRGNYLLITADTIVVCDQIILHKPKDEQESIKLLERISGKKHYVISSFYLKTKDKDLISSSKTIVYFNTISPEEINFYIEKFKPYDKAGSYAIQEWIGHIGVKQIHGSYNNVVGLDTSKLYQKLFFFI